jgi:hypothetical protein
MKGMRRECFGIFHEFSGRPGSDPQPVIGEANGGAKYFAIALVMYAVGDVGEIGHLRADFLGRFDCFWNREMGGMRVELKTVEDQHVEIF